MAIGDAIGSGRKTVTTAGTAVKLANATKCTGVCITGETDNLDIVCVGNSAVVAALSARTGVPLSAGDSISFPVVDLDQVWLDSVVSGEGVSYFWVNDVRK